MHCATLAQLVEHSIRNRKVVGSNPTGGSIKINKLRTFLGYPFCFTHTFTHTFNLNLVINRSNVPDDKR